MVWFDRGVYPFVDVLVGALVRDLPVEPIFFKNLPAIDDSFESLGLIDDARGDFDLGRSKALARGDFDRSLSPATRACGDLDLRLSRSKSLERECLEEESLASLECGDLDRGLGLRSAYKLLGHGDLDRRLALLFNSLGRGDCDLGLSDLDVRFFGFVLVSLVFFFFFLVVSVSLLLDTRDPSTFGGPSTTGLYTIFRCLGLLVSGTAIKSNSLGGPPLDDPPFDGL